MSRRGHVFALVGALGLLACRAGPSPTRPTSSATASEASEQLVIGRVSPGGVVAVETRVVGEGPSELRASVEVDGARVSSDERLVFAFDAEGRLEAFARRLVGPSLEEGVLLVFAARGVPRIELLTLERLSERARTGSTTQRLALRLSFYDDEGVPQRSAIRYELIGDGTRERFDGPPGAGPLEGVRVDPRGHVWLALDLDAASTDASVQHRVVDFNGEVHGVDDEGTILVDLVATQPMIDEATFAAMLADPARRVAGTMVSVEVEGRGSWRWRYPDALVDARGVVHPSEASGGGREALADGRVREWWEHAFADGLRLELAATVEDGEWPAPLLSLVRADRVACTLWEDGRALPCVPGEVEVEVEGLGE